MVKHFTQREREREREREKEKERKRERERKRSRRIDAQRRESTKSTSPRPFEMVPSRKKREDSTLEPSKSLGKSNLPRERERERESPRNVRPRPRTLTVLYVNRSSFRSFKMLPKPMLSRRPKHPLFARKAHESNWCPSKGAL